VSLKIFAYWMRNYKNCPFYTRFKLFYSWLPFFYPLCTGWGSFVKHQSCKSVRGKSHERWTRWKTTEYRVAWAREDGTSQLLKCVPQALLCVAELQVVYACKIRGGPFVAQNRKFWGQPPESCSFRSISNIYILWSCMLWYRAVW
jgi:hypothetical protein